MRPRVLKATPSPDQAALFLQQRFRLLSEPRHLSGEHPASKGHTGRQQGRPREGRHGPRGTGTRASSCASKQRPVGLQVHPNYVQRVRAPRHQKAFSAGLQLLRSFLTIEVSLGKRNGFLVTKNGVLSARRPPRHPAAADTRQRTSSLTAAISPQRGGAPGLCHRSRDTASRRGGCLAPFTTAQAGRGGSTSSSSPISAQSPMLLPSVACYDQRAMISLLSGGHQTVPLPVEGVRGSATTSCHAKEANRGR